MAHQGQEILNPVSGQRMVFSELGPERLVIDSVSPPSGKQREPEHVHPRQESGAEVREGELVFEVEGNERRVRPGESITIPAGTPHRFWNPGEGDARADQWFRPALDTASFFETYFEIARQGGLGEDGSLPLLRVAVLVPEFSEEIRLTSPPWPLVRALTTILGPIARARGLEGRLSYGDSSLGSPGEGSGS